MKMFSTKTNEESPAISAASETCRSGDRRSVGAVWLIALLLKLFSSTTFAAAPDPNDPAVELASFKVADGFEVNLFASEINGVPKPIQIRFDSRGRMFVATSTVYPQLKPGQKPDDKVVILEDTDGDGRADKSTVFADGLLIPTGIELFNGGLFVGNATELLHFQDKDLDGKADQRQVVLRGFGTGDAHQTINSFTWSPGGELFFSQGLHAMSRVETPFGLVKLHEAGVWRLRPNTLKLDPFFGDGMAPHNPWGFAFDDWGAPFLFAGNGHGIFYLAPALVVTDHKLDHQRIWAQGQKFCGAEIIGTRAMPDAFQGCIVANRFMDNTVVMFRPVDDGAGFKLTELPPLIVSTNTSFRPVDIRTGPDGALYIADWFNPIIGHYQASFRDPRRDQARGRIWRVAAKGRPAPPRVAFNQLTLPQLFDELKSDERWNRFQAKRTLAEQEPAFLTNAFKLWIDQLNISDPLYERHLVEALGVFESQEIVIPQLLGSLLAAKDFRARAYAASVIGRWQDRLTNAVDLVGRAARDPHPRVRLQGVVSASSIPTARALEAALLAVDQPIDRFVNEALVKTIHALKPHWAPELAAGRLNLETTPQRLEFLLKTDASAASLGVVTGRLKQEGLSKETRERFLGILANVGGPAELERVLASSSYGTGNGYDAVQHARLLPALVQAEKLRRVRPSGDLAAALGELLKHPEGELKAGALRLAGAWKLAALRPRLISMATDSSAPAALRRAAVDGLADLGGAEDKATLAKLSGESPGAVRARAIAALAGLDPGAGARAAVAFLGNAATDAEWTEVWTAFLQRKDGAARLAAAFADVKPARDAARIGLRLMGSSGRRDETLARIVTAAAGFPNEARALSPDETAALVQQVKTSGDARRGAEIFQRPELSCTACHAINGKGGDIGPDMSALGTAQPVDFIIGAILQPNKEVKEGFMAHGFTLANGDEFQGYIQSETASEIVLRDHLQQREVRLRRADVKERRQIGSVMPPGLADTLTQAELRDLVRYLSELGKR